MVIRVVLFLIFLQVTCFAQARKLTNVAVPVLTNEWARICTHGISEGKRFDFCLAGMEGKLPDPAKAALAGQARQSSLFNLAYFYKTELEFTPTEKNLGILTFNGMELGEAYLRTGYARYLPNDVIPEKYKDSYEDNVRIARFFGSGNFEKDPAVILENRPVRTPIEAPINGTYRVKVTCWVYSNIFSFTDLDTGKHYHRVRIASLLPPDPPDDFQQWLADWEKKRPFPEYYATGTLRVFDGVPGQAFAQFTLSNGQDYGELLLYSGLAAYHEEAANLPPVWTQIYKIAERDARDESRGMWIGKPKLADGRKMEAVSKALPIGTKAKLFITLAMPYFLNGVEPEKKDDRAAHVYDLSFAGVRSAATTLTERQIYTDLILNQAIEVTILAAPENKPMLVSAFFQGTDLGAYVLEMGLGSIDETTIKLLSPQRQALYKRREEQAKYARKGIWQ